MSEQDPLNPYVEKLDKYLQDHELEFDSKPINYGMGYSLFEGSVKVSLYHGKKGFKFVTNGKDKEAVAQLEQELSLLFSGGSGEAPKPTDSTEVFAPIYSFTWTGSDESGKGDYFLALWYVQVFVWEPEDINRLQKTGLQDSKALADKKIRTIAKSIFSLGRSKFKILSLKPKKYNELYQKFSSQGKSLNDLLAWMHATVAKDLLDGVPDVRLILVDQFASDAVMRRYMGDNLKRADFLQRTKGEANLAIAAGSVLARYELLCWHDQIKEELGFELPRGAGSMTISAGRQLVERCGESRLNEFAKLHFKTTSDILG